MARSVRTLPIASAAGDPNFSIADDDWRKIEKAYGHILSPTVRRKILKVTFEFVYFEVFERTAAPVSGSIDRIKSIDNALKEPFLTLHAPSDVTKVYADHVVKRHFNDPRLRLDRGDLFNAISGVLSSLKVACTKALQELHDPQLLGHREGDCWRQWIRRMTKIVRDIDLPSAASKGGDKGNAHSPFVLMVESMQKTCVPKAARRYNHSNAALAVAISRARSAAAMFLAMLTAVTTLCWSQPSFALTGRDALAFCEPPAESLYCTLLVSGYFDMSHAIVARGGSLTHCNPDLTVGIAREVFVAYMKARPALLTQQAAEIYLSALQQAFPCRR
jgi:hypothetical protein